MNQQFVDWYGQRNWTREGWVQTMTRIDVPMPGATLPPGDYNIAGVAYAGDRGLGKVEYSADGGQKWHQAKLLETPAGHDSWVRWIGQFTLRPGTQTTLVSRATDASGALQVKDFSLPEPDGSAGWHTVEVRAADEMRRNGEPIEDGERSRILSVYSPTVNSAEELLQTLSAVPPSDAWATYLWLDDQKTGTDRAWQQMQHAFIQANILQIEGKRPEALAAFETLRSELKKRGYDGRIATHVDSSIKRLSTP